MKTIRLILVFLVLSVAGVSAKDDGWGPWSFLMGQWTGEGSGEPGQGAGSFSFEAGLQDRVVMRKNRADYPATKDRPAFSHEDLMVMYRDAGGRARAIYFDSEGHVIEYAAEVSRDGKTAVFLSEAAPSAPRYRLTYTKKEDGTLGIHFEVAPPGKPEAFQTYIEAKARRKTG